MSEVVNPITIPNRVSSPWWSQNPGGYWGVLTDGTPGNYSVGVQVMLPAAPTTIYGAYFRTAMAGAHTIRIRLWKAAATVATADIPCAGPGWYQGVFVTPYVVLAADAPETAFVLSMYETTGTHFTYYDSSPSYLATWFFRNHFTINHPRLYSAGDAIPASVAQGGMYPIDPYVVY